MLAKKSMSSSTAAETLQRIFLVEDSPLIRDCLIDVLDSAEDGRRVVGTAETENDAVREIAEAEPDVAIIDLNLREGSGIGVLERLSSLDEPPVAIVYTSHCDAGLRAQCEELGATHVLPKTGDIRELLGVLTDVD